MKTEPKSISEVMAAQSSELRALPTPKPSGLQRSTLEPMRIAEALRNIARGVANMSAEEREIVERACATLGVSLPVLFEERPHVGHD